MEFGASALDYIHSEEELVAVDPHLSSSLKLNTHRKGEVRNTSPMSTTNSSPSSTGTLSASPTNISLFTLSSEDSLEGND